MDVPPPSLLRLPLPIGISLVPCLLHRLGLCNQAIDLLTAEDLPQEAEVFDFCPEHPRLHFGLRAPVQSVYWVTTYHEPFSLFL